MVSLLLLILSAVGQTTTSDYNYKSGFRASLRGGYDVKPMYDNQTPYIDYKGGWMAGASVNYYWNWIGVGADFDYINNQPRSTHPYDTMSVTKMEKKITRMFYGIGPSFKYEKSNKFNAELFLRGGLANIKGGETSVSLITPAMLTNYHAGYDAKNVLSAKAQAQVNYYFNSFIGVHAGAYYMRHFNVPELTNATTGITAGYLSLDPINPTFISRNPIKTDISSIGAFAGVSFRIPKRKRATVVKECVACETLSVAVTAKDKFTKVVLPNTDVVLKNEYGEILYSGTTNDYGVIVFDKVKSGNYTVSGKLYGVDLDNATINATELKPDITLQKEILYSDEQFILKGQVVECNAASPLTNASVVLNNKTVAEQKTSQTDDKGFFVFHALQNSSYSIYAKKNNYFSRTETISTKEFDRNNTLFIKLEVCMEKTDCGKAIVLKNIYYDLDKYFIREDAKPELDKLVQFMKDNPGVKVELSSHTDSRASDSYNMTLSQNRANAAVDYLVSQGISKQRLTGVGYGESRLLNKCGNGVNCSEAEHQINRRTEIKVICPDAQ